MNNDKGKNLSKLTMISAGELALGQTAYFEDIDDLSLLQSGNYRALDESYIEHLTESIRDAGIANPISVVIERSSEKKPKFLIVDGHQRVAAIKYLREEAQVRGEEWLYRKLPIKTDVVLEGTWDRKKSLISVVSNQVHKKETAFERARGMARLMEQGGYSKERLARLLGVNRKTVDRTLLLLQLPQDLVREVEQSSSTVPIKESTLYSAAALYRRKAKEDKESAAELARKRIFTPEKRSSQSYAGIDIADLIANLENEGMPKKWLDKIRGISA